MMDLYLLSVLRQFRRGARATVAPGLHDRELLELTIRLAFDEGMVTPRRAPYRPRATVYGGPCRLCACTEEDCSSCIKATGRPCYWIDRYLCSRCGPHELTRAGVRTLAELERDHPAPSRREGPDPTEEAEEPRPVGSGVPQAQKGNP